ncbi:hypothetical protein Tco_1282485 [Tanacetum coccineum]
MVNEGIALNTGLDSKASTYDNTSTKQQDRSSSSGYAADAKRVCVDKVVSEKENVTVGPSYDNDTLTKVHHSNNDTFENVFALGIQNHEQLQVENYTKLTPSLYNIDEMGKYLLSDPKIISEEELKCDIMRKVQNQFSEEFEPLARNKNHPLRSFEQSLVKEMKDDLKYVMSLKDEFDEKCLILDIQTEFFKTKFKSTISESYSHVYENGMFEQNPSLECENRCLRKTIA